VEKKETPVFDETSHWLYFDPGDRDLLLKHMMDATSGKSVVVGKYPFRACRARLIVVIACGDPDFSTTVRESVIDRRATQLIDFVEVQYRPSIRSSRAIDNVSSEGEEKLSGTDIDLEKGTGKRRTKDAGLGKKRGKLSTTNDIDLEKEKSKPRRMLQEEDERWDEVTLYSPTSTIADDGPPKKWQKKTD
jgi:hypothetical protein